MKTKIIASALILAAIVTGCKKEKEEIIPTTQDQVENSSFITTINVDLPAELSNKEITITTSGSDIVNSENISVEIPADNKEFVFATNSVGDILLASPVISENTLISYSTTAETFISMLPWTGFLSAEQLKNIVAEIQNKDDYKQLVIQIEKVVKENKSPLDDVMCIELLNKLNTSIFADELGGISEKKLRIPDVDFLVEPIITYSGNIVTIKNDGQTTATWGVQFLNQEGDALSEPLMLRGNELDLPGLSSIVDFFIHDKTIELLKKSAPITYSINPNIKYQIDFRSPTSPTILQGKLATDAALYNVYYNYSIFLGAFGIELPEMPTLNPSDFLNLNGCTKDLFATTFDNSIEALSRNELDDEFIISSVQSIFKQSVDAIANCTEIGGKISNSSYVKNIAKFIDVSSKLESAFKIGKIIGDMAVLSDINICRQFIQGEMYSCFDMEKNTIQSLEDEVHCPDTEIELSVKTILETLIPDENTYPEGLVVTWEYTNAEGQILTTTSKINSKGIAKYDYTTTDKDNQTVKAIIKNGDFTTDKVEFNLIVDKQQCYIKNLTNNSSKSWANLWDAPSSGSGLCDGDMEYKRPRTTFKSGGTFSEVYARCNYGATLVYTGTWSISGDILTLNYNYNETTWKIEGEIIELTEESLIINPAFNFAWTSSLSNAY